MRGFRPNNISLIRGCNVDKALIHSLIEFPGGPNTAVGALEGAGDCALIGLVTTPLGFELVGVVIRIGNISSWHDVSLDETTVCDDAVGVDRTNRTRTTSAVWRERGRREGMKLAWAEDGG